jgi:fumarylacetoacetate (FAA) hydrolase family protein
MKYTVTGKSVLITGGVLTLSSSQASDRSHLLKKIDAKGNKYEVLGAVTFKKGEEFGYEGELPKSLASDLQTEKDAKGTKAAEKAEKEAAEKAEKEAAEKAEKEAAEGDK